jgi:mono/diheme cytochrome c family protein
MRRLLAAFILLSCGTGPKPPVPLDRPLEPAADPGERARGEALLRDKQCARCHDGDLLEPAPRERHCVRCHQSILAGEFTAPPADLARWQRDITHLREVPALRGLGRLRRESVAAFLRAPHDLRPHLDTGMPRLPLAPGEAEALAAALVPEPEPAPSEPAGDPERGRALLTDAGCMTCHLHTGVPGLPIRPLTSPLSAELQLRATAQAPDLRFTRDRLRPAGLHAWLTAPSAVKPGTLMPDLDLRPDQVRDLATYLLTAPITAPEPPVPTVSLPLLDRPVRFAEVDAAIFRRTCWHCHSDPDFADGDGGPGNTGGLGYPGRGLDLSSLAGVAGGSRGPDGKRRSVFAPLPDGTPRIVAHLLARHDELAGRIDPELRGMPLALTPIPLADIQLLATWISQGRPE